MDEAVKHVVSFGQLAGEPLDLILELDVADKNRRIADQLLHLLSPFLAADDVHDLGPRLDQHAADVPGHALAIGHAHHEDALAGELEKISRHALFQCEVITTETRKTRRRNLEE